MHHREEKATQPGAGGSHGSDEQESATSRTATEPTTPDPKIAAAAVSVQQQQLRAKAPDKEQEKSAGAIPFQPMPQVHLANATELDSLSKLLLRRLSDVKPSPQPQSPPSTPESAGGARRKSIVRDPVQEAVRLFALEVIRAQEFRLLLCDLVRFMKHLLKLFSHAHRARQLKLQNQDEIFGNTTKERDLIGRMRTVIRHINDNSPYRTALINAPLFLTTEAARLQQETAAGEAAGGSEAVRMIEDYTGPGSMEKLLHYASLIKQHLTESGEPATPAARLLERTQSIIFGALENGFPCLEEFRRSMTELMVDNFKVVSEQEGEDMVGLLSAFLGEVRHMFCKFADDEAVRSRSKAEASRQRYKLVLRISGEHDISHKTHEPIGDQEPPPIQQTQADALVSLREAACFAFSEQLLAPHQVPKKRFQLKTSEGTVSVLVNTLVLKMEGIQPSQLRVDVKKIRPSPAAEDEQEDAGSKRPNCFFKVKASEVRMSVVSADWIVASTETQKQHMISSLTEKQATPAAITATILVWMGFTGTESSEKGMELRKIRAQIEMSPPSGLEEIGDDETQLIEHIITGTYTMRHTIAGMLEDSIITGESEFVRNLASRISFVDLSTLFVEPEQM